MKINKLILFYKMSRAPFLSVTILPIIYTITSTRIDIPLLHIVFLIIGVSSAHLAANLLNDFFDRDINDIHNNNYSEFNGGSVHAVGKDIKIKSYLFLSVAMLFTAFLCLLYFIINTGFNSIIPAILGLACALLYSVKPFSFQSNGLGEILIFLAFGPLLTWGANTALTGHLQFIFLLYGVPWGLMTLSIILINQIPDYESDLAAGKRNLTVKFGKKSTMLILCVIQFLIATYLFLISLSAIHCELIIGVGIIFTIASVLFISKFRKEYLHKSIVKYQRIVVLSHLIFGSLLILSTTIPGSS